MSKPAWTKPKLKTVKVPPKVKTLLILILRDEQKPRKIKTFDPPGVGENQKRPDASQAQQQNGG